MAQISIAEVRREILRAGGGVGAHSSASTALAGRIFHEVLAELMGPGGWQAALEPQELADAGRLSTHVYDKFLGPRVTNARASLQESGAETLALWEAVQSMCGWTCRLIDGAAQRGTISFDRSWKDTEALCSPEHPLRWELKEPHWTAPVVISGIADAIWMDPSTGRWCVVEYKLGQGRPEADLAQASLYHAMLVAGGLAAGDGALAMLSFRPQLEERLYSTAELAEAQAALRELIGRLAGVLPAPALSEQPLPPQPAMRVEPAHVHLGERLVRALEHYGIAVKWNGEVIAGPTFLRYPVMPGRKVRVKSIIDKSEDLAVQLSLEEPPLIHVSGGRLVLDVQRFDRRVVPFSSIFRQIPSPDRAGNSNLPLGVDLMGKLQFVDLASPNNPHILVAGTSGSGKSEFLRSAIAGILWANTPETLRLVLIDPKRNAFTELKGSRFLWGRKGLLYPPDDSALETLEALIEEMENRYRRLSCEGAADILELREKTGEVVPRIVCVCDEYADLIADRATKREIEGAITRLGAKARAAGIHLVIATQYPDRNTVGGALKMNLGGRVCLRTTNHIQSNMIINQSGAEKLLGRGDLFFLSIGDPVRLQAPFVSAGEREAIFNAGIARTSAARGA